MAKMVLLTLLGVVSLLSLTHGLPAPTEVPILRPESYTTNEDLEAFVVDGEGSGEGTTTEAENNESGSSGVKEIDPNDCFLAKSRGPCRAVIDSWFFNVATKSCEPFSWSGCGGNSNRFPEKLLCESQCSKPAGAGTTGEVPKNVSETATSSASTSAPTSTSSTARPVLTTKHKLPDCPKFDGCPDKCVIIQDRSDRGCKKCLCGSPNEAENKNRVPGPTQVSSGNNVTIVKAPEISVGSVSGLPDADSIDEDDLPIVGNPEDNCQLPQQRGHCRAMMTRYRYDPKSKDCVVFHYGGCDGNPNNFVTKEKCLEYCKGQ